MHKSSKNGKCTVFATGMGICSGNSGCLAWFFRPSGQFYAPVIEYIVPKEASAVCRVYVDGTCGKSTRMGTPLKTLMPAEQCADIAEKAILWYRENGYAKERFAATIDRLGIDKLKRALLNDNLLRRRDAILAADIRERI